jgi:hypothetical protein
VSSPFRSPSASGTFYAEPQEVDGAPDCPRCHIPMQLGAQNMTDDIVHPVTYGYTWRCKECNGQFNETRDSKLL